MKVLVISNNCFSNLYNNGKTLKAIFSKFSKDELCMLFFRPRNEIPSSICSNYYLISDKQMLNSIIMPWKLAGRPINLHGINNDIESLKIQEPKMNRTTFKQCLRELLWILGHKNNYLLYNWLYKQKPDIIFLMGSYSIFVSKIAIEIKQKLNIPMAVYYTDDYIVYSPKSLYKHFLINTYKKVLKNCSQFYAIGDDMAEDYKNYFHKDFKPIMNMVDKIEFKKKDVTDEINISYFGSLYFHRFEAILKFARMLLNKSHRSISVPIRFNIYSSSILDADQLKLCKKFNILYRGFVTGVDLNKAMEEADFYLHVESDSRQNIQLVKLSVSTKIPEYLMAGRPIIAFGPRNVASIKLCDNIDHRMVIFCDENEYINEGIDNVILMLKDINIREDVAKNGYNYACEHFDREVVALKFKNEIRAMCNR